jgi:ribosomal protein S12 methylthiotransferase
MKTQNAISLENNKKLLGSTIKVIIDNTTKEGQFYGRSYGDAPDIDQTVFINNTNIELQRGQIIHVKITKAYTYDLIGDVENELS